MVEKTEAQKGEVPRLKSPWIRTQDCGTPEPQAACTPPHPLTQTIIPCHLAACLSSHLLSHPSEPQAFLFLSPSRQLFMPVAPPALSKCRTVIPLQKCTGFPQAALWEQSCLPSPLWVKTLQDPVKGQKSSKVKRR